jgi:23S rRNA (guanosine2251-2'-O)-methyltransferase
VVAVSETRLVHGFHAVVSRLRQRPDAVRAVYVDAARSDRRMRELIALAAEHQVRLAPVDAQRLDGMAPQGRHQGVVAEVAMAPQRTLDEILDALTQPALLLVLDGVQDPHNLGACLRVADAFGVHAVVAPKDRAAGLNATVAKVASGAAETVPFVAVTNLARTLREIKERGVWVVGADADAPAGLYDATFTGALAWVLGAEGEGMRRLTREACDERVGIPMLGTVQSLNVSVAAGVCLGETLRQRRASAAKTLPKSERPFENK